MFIRTLVCNMYGHDSNLSQMPLTFFSSFFLGGEYLTCSLMTRLSMIFAFLFYSRPASAISV